MTDATCSMSKLFCPDPNVIGKDRVLVAVTVIMNDETLSVECDSQFNIIVASSDMLLLTASLLRATRNAAAATRSVTCSAAFSTPTVLLVPRRRRRLHLLVRRGGRQPRHDDIRLLPLAGPCLRLAASSPGSHPLRQGEAGVHPRAAGAIFEHSEFQELPFHVRCFRVWPWFRTPATTSPRFGAPASKAPAETHT